MPPKVALKSEKKSRRVLSINDKLEIIEKMEQGVSRSALINEYNIGSSTLYDIRRSKPKLLEFIASNDPLPITFNRKNLRKPKLEILDKVLHEWFQLRRTEGVTVSGPMIIAKAKDFAEQMQLNTDLHFSVGWLTRFKSRHGIRSYNISGEKSSADLEAAKSYCFNFEKDIIKKYDLTPEQIYNADESALLWKCLPKRTFIGFDERSAADFKDNLQRVTMLVCANASGQHKMDLLVIGKYQHSQGFKGVNHPVIYKTQENGWMNKEIFQEWFYEEFVPAARQNLLNLGKSLDSKCVLLLDSRWAFPYASTLVSDCGNIFACYLPTNVNPLIQPMNQGIIENLKCKYRTKFMEQLIQTKVSIPIFQSKYSIKDAIVALALAWKEVKPVTIFSAWRKLWPNAMFSDLPSNEEEQIEGRQNIREIIQTNDNVHLHNLVDEDIEEWLKVDSNSDVNPKYYDQEIMDSTVAPPNTQEFAVCPEVKEEDEPEPKINWLTAQACMDTVIKFMEQEPSFTMQDVLQGHMLRNMMLTKNQMSLKQPPTEHL